MSPRCDSDSLSEMQRVSSARRYCARRQYRQTVPVKNRAFDERIICTINLHSYTQLYIGMFHFLVKSLQARLNFGTAKCSLVLVNKVNDTEIRLIVVPGLNVLLIIRMLQ